MRTITVQIGNSDDKLTQHEWADFVQNTGTMLGNFGQIHYHGCSEGSRPWQNAAWIIAIEDDGVGFIIKNLTEIRKLFRQDSAAITVGETQFV